MRFALIRHVLPVVFFALFSVGRAIAADSVEAGRDDLAETASRQLIMLVAESSEWPTDPEDLALHIRTAAGSNDAVWTRLGRPVSSSPLIDVRASREERRAEDFNPILKRLESYSVLTYASREEALAALADLSKDINVLGVNPNRLFQRSSAPNDPIAPYVPGVTSPLNGQWALHALGLASTWDLVVGHAYVGVLDNGIPPEHEDLVQSIRFHMSSGFQNGATKNVMPQDIDEGRQNHTRPVWANGHGSHVAGIIAAKGNNGLGVAGVCWNCNLLIGRIGWGATVTEADYVNGLIQLLKRGSQVINSSFGYSVIDCGGVVAACDAMALVELYDVSLVAASGNFKTSQQFPASDGRAIGVGGIQQDGNLWDATVALPNSAARTDLSEETGTNYGANQYFVAPARDVLSTFYYYVPSGGTPAAIDYRVDIRCGTSPTFAHADLTPSPTPGFASTASYQYKYGLCNGTSMAAPYISGIMALMRSADPLASSATTVGRLTAHASRSSNYDLIWGYGVPNTTASIGVALQANSRLTPLFALYSPEYNDYLYTTAPQMGRSAQDKNLLPAATAGAKRYYSYPVLGNLVAGMNSFPGVTKKTGSGITNDHYKARARFKVFTTPKDSAGTSLSTIYRFSYKDSAPNSTVVRHFLAIGESDKAAVLPIWALDGVEGYVYPPQIAQPAGTTKIYRYVKVSTSTYVIFPDGEQSYWAGQGFQTDGTSHLGYAPLN